MPRETILCTSAAKVMLSKSFAGAMGIHAADLDLGIEFGTVGGAVEVPMGVTRKKVVLILSRGTLCEHRVSLLVTVVDTIEYDVLLGMEYMAAHKVLCLGGIMTPTVGCLGTG